MSGTKSVVLKKGYGKKMKKALQSGFRFVQAGQWYLVRDNSVIKGFDTLEEAIDFALQ